MAHAQHAPESGPRHVRQGAQGGPRTPLRNRYGLTIRELTVLHLVATGKADKEIARELGISPLTIHKHLSNILGKMHASSRTEAGIRAIRDGLVD